MQRGFNRTSLHCQHQPLLDKSPFRGGALAVSASAIGRIPGTGRRWRNWLVCHQHLPRRKLLMRLLRQRYRVTRQQVATVDGRDTGQVCGPCDKRIRITEQIRHVATNQGQRTAWLYVNRGNVGHNQTSVKAPCNAGPGQGRVGVVRHHDALPLAVGHN